VSLITLGAVCNVKAENYGFWHIANHNKPQSSVIYLYSLSKFHKSKNKKLFAACVNRTLCPAGECKSRARYDFILFYDFTIHNNNNKNNNKNNNNNKATDIL